MMWKATGMEVRIGTIPLNTYLNKFPLESKQPNIWIMSHSFIHSGDL